MHEGGCAWRRWRAAGVAAAADQRDKLERLCRYICRPAHGHDSLYWLARNLVALVSVLLIAFLFILAMKKLVITRETGDPARAKFSARDLFFLILIVGNF